MMFSPVTKQPSAMQAPDSIPSISSRLHQDKTKPRRSLSNPDLQNLETYEVLHSFNHLLPTRPKSLKISFISLVLQSLLSPAMNTWKHLKTNNIFLLKNVQNHFCIFENYKDMDHYLLNLKEIIIILLAKILPNVFFIQSNQAQVNQLVIVEGYNNRIQ